MTGDTKTMVERMYADSLKVCMKHPLEINRLYAGEEEQCCISKNVFTFENVTDP